MVLKNLNLEFYLYPTQTTIAGNDADRLLQTDVLEVIYQIIADNKPDIVFDESIWTIDSYLYDNSVKCVEVLLNAFDHSTQEELRPKFFFQIVDRKWQYINILWE